MPWKQYNIGNTKNKGGVKIGYKGTFKTYAKLTGATFKTNVKITVYSGKSNLKWARWKTYHTAYGLLGSNGSTPSLGIVYNGSISSSKIKGNFTFYKTNKYSYVYACYLKTWGNWISKRNQVNITLQQKRMLHLSKGGK